MLLLRQKYSNNKFNNWTNEVNVESNDLVTYNALFNYIRDLIMKIVILDNPGKGNCLFHSIVFALIHNIQTINKTNPSKARDLWDQWATLGEINHSLSFETLLQIDLYSDPKKETVLKIKLQNSLRIIAVKAFAERSDYLFSAQCKPDSKPFCETKQQIASLNVKLEEHDQLLAKVSLQEEPARLLQATIDRIRANNNYKWTDESSEINKTRLAILKQLSETPENQKLLELRKSQEINELRNQRSLLIQNPIERDPLYINFKNIYDHFKVDNTAFEDCHNIFFHCEKVIHLAKILARTVDNEELLATMIKAENRTLIMQALNQIKTRNYWGTAEHAAAIFRALNVNSHILNANQRATTPDFSSGVEAPLICIININDSHWVTGIYSEKNSDPHGIVTLYEAYPEKTSLISTSFINFDENFRPIYPMQQIRTKGVNSRLLLKNSEEKSECPFVKKRRPNKVSPKNISAKGQVDAESKKELLISLSEFHRASSQNDILTMTQYLIGNKSNPYLQTIAGPLLIKAAQRGCWEVIDTLLEGKVSINTVDHLGNTALHWAAWNQHSVVVEALLKRNADPMIKNKNGNLASKSAEHNGNNMILEMLTNAESHHLTICEQSPALHA